jgi:hypothetical protein
MLYHIHQTVVSAQHNIGKAMKTVDVEGVSSQCPKNVTLWPTVMNAVQSSSSVAFATVQHLYTFASASM